MTAETGTLLRYAGFVTWALTSCNTLDFGLRFEESGAAKLARRLGRPADPSVARGQFHVMPGTRVARRTDSGRRQAASSA